ncbi:MAG: hypothetical protein D6711_14225 [Chloroflexi bacterium]|nr:MAG: hypothetical protein D6711_14225 [Chloroflexota bacterium]
MAKLTKKELVKLKNLDNVLKGVNYVETREFDRLIRSAVRKIAMKTRNAIRRKAPVATELPYTTKTGQTRIKRGVLKNAIKAKHRRPKRNGAGYSYRSDVVVTRGKKEQFDAFYWFWVEYGFFNKKVGRYIPGQNFIEPEKQKARNNFESLLEAETRNAIEREIQKRFGG